MRRWFAGGEGSLLFKASDSQPRERHEHGLQNQPTEAARQSTETLQLLQQHVPMVRRVVHTGDRLFQTGERFTSCMC